MEKQKKWQFVLIILVIALTLYNILPTLFYYGKPLKRPIDETKAKEIALSMTTRVNSLEKESTQWLRSYCNLLRIKPTSIALDPNNPQLITLLFTEDQNANKFRTFFPPAGAIIPFAPAQLSLTRQSFEENSKRVIIQRKIPIHFGKDLFPGYFAFAEKNSSAYQEVILDRAATLGNAVGGYSEPGLILATILDNPASSANRELTYTLASQLVQFVHVFSENSPITQRYFATFTQGPLDSKASALQAFTTSINEVRDSLKLQRGKEISEENIRLIERKEEVLLKAAALIKKYHSVFSKGSPPFTYDSLYAQLNGKNRETFETIPVGGRNPFIKELSIDWSQDRLLLTLYNDVFLEKNRESVERLLINEVARITHLSGEKIAFRGDELSLPMHSLNNITGLLTLNLTEFAKAQVDQLQHILKNYWHPKHPELTEKNFPIWDYETYQNLPADQKSLGLVILAPALLKNPPAFGFRTNSIYIIAKGVDTLIHKYQAHQESEDAKAFIQDFHHLQEVLKQNGYGGYSGSLLPLSLGFTNDFIFEKDDYYQTILQATRENFKVLGSKKYAILEFTDMEQRILTLNKIETQIHEDLLKARDDYQASQVSIDLERRYDAPKPIKNVFWNNFVLSFFKYFRGDERKVLHWGLDLSGGKTVTIELRDQNNRTVTDEASLKQGVNELYNRVNKMGVSEVGIHLEGSHIILDFPGSQNLSAAELVKASSMYFHVVNEKFSSHNSLLANATNLFLQEVWNEALVTNQKDIESINRIAFKHLYGDTLQADLVQPQSEAAKTLYESGLQLADPLNSAASSAFNDSLSKIAILRGNEYSNWQGQTNPLLIVFHNFSLEGSNLENIHTSYDPSKGNYLTFEVKGTYIDREGQKIYPREDFYAWTSPFSKDKITGTANAEFSQGKGWRMAVILNEQVISSPTLEQGLRNNAMITGGFSLREANKLVADLKAGSLTFSPKILSEKNVSPELGAKDRTRGILAMCIALLLVITSMSFYYRFAGIVASVAVFFNLLILWATLQNLHATLTLASIAGIILTVGMAVDANVLVFERIREEFAITGRLSSAVAAGYKKAFSAILDSNITTIIAAFILLHFDSGPIKGFAITLIIGIVSSMFTALFMTKYFFSGWVQDPTHKTLNMATLLQGTSFLFLPKAKLFSIISAIIILSGTLTCLIEKSAFLGMDFTGGFALNIEVVAKKGEHYRETVEKALISAGAKGQDIQVRELTPPNNLRILLSTGLENPGKPFYQLPIESGKKDITYAYENNPRIVWTVDALKQGGFTFTPRMLEHLDSQWTVTSGQLSDSMRNSALFGLALALIAILIYITFRFEFKFAISAILCTLHDVLITIGAISLLHYLGVPVQMDLNTIAALMTIIGYSLNDTIIIFDRIREDIRLMRKSTFAEVIHHALNVTLSRTMITSGTTLLVLLALVALGGPTIFGFALVMTLGVVFGTLSSLFIAPPILLFFHKKEQGREAAILNGY